MPLVLTEQFWDDYTDRQPRADQAAHLRRLLKPWLPNINSVLEVGCNRGDNLQAFDCDKVYGVEPNEYARKQAWAKGFPTWDASADSLPFGDDEFDLVFTVGVLIHVPPSKLDKSLFEIHRVSKRYVLAVEYEASVPEPVDYRGVRAGIWKRPYGAEYHGRFRDLVAVGGGDAAEFDGCKWWMFDKCICGEINARNCPVHQ